MTILPVKQSANRSALRANHYFFYFQPYQVNRLRHLQQTVNGLFPQSRAIAVVDLLYAVLWKRVSTLRACGSLAVLTVIEPAAFGAASQVNEAHPPGHENLEKSIFVCEAEVLARQSPVGIAQHIRNHLCSSNSESTYEGWLVDSLPHSNSSADYPDGLICTTLSLPALQRVDRRYGGWRWVNNDVADCARRVCSVNATPQQDGALSVDMQLPRDEIERFKFRYGDAHSVPPEFYEN